MGFNWLNYVENVFDISQITHVVVYTDKHQFWLLNGFHSIFKDYNIPVTTKFLDNVSSEEAWEIKQSMDSLSETTLLVAFFSPNNIKIDILNQIFPPLRGPDGFNGWSLIGLQNFQAQNFSDFIMLDYQSVLNQMDYYQDIIRPEGKYLLNSINNSQLELEFKSKLFNFPFHSSLGKNILFPSTELIAEVVPESVSGKLIIDGTIGDYKQSNILYDPFGRVNKLISIEFDQGSIIRIAGEDRFVSRLEAVIEGWNAGIQKLGIGIGPNMSLTGIIEVDKMLFDTCNVSLGDRELDLLFLGPRFTLL